MGLGTCSECPTRQESSASSKAKQFRTHSLLLPIKLHQPPDSDEVFHENADKMPSSDLLLSEWSTKKARLPKACMISEWQRRPQKQVAGLDELARLEASRFPH